MLTIDQELRDLIPPLTPDERHGLEASLRSEGCRDPLVVWSGHDVILDGHNRHEICTAHGLAYNTTGMSFQNRDSAKAWIIRNQFARRNLTPYQRAELALKLEPLIAERAKGNQRRAGGAVPQKSAEAVETRQEVARLAGVSHDTIAKAKTIAERAPEPVKEALRRGETSINAVHLKLTREEDRATKRETSVQRILGAAVDRFPVIYADPPWLYEHAVSDSRAIENQYPTMTLEEICALEVDGKPMPQLAHDDAVLFLWATSPKLAEAMQVIEAWGFTYRTSMVWVKDKIGMGYYARQRHELLLIAARGSMPTPSPQNRPDSVIEAPRGKHSEKPVAFAEAIERMYDGLPRIELFCRLARDGWASFGNEI